jgi:hypothetical protein
MGRYQFQQKIDSSLLSNYSYANEDCFTKFKHYAEVNLLRREAEGKVMSNLSRKVFTLSETKFHTHNRIGTRYNFAYCKPLALDSAGVGGGNRY